MIDGSDRVVGLLPAAPALPLRPLTYLLDDASSTWLLNYGTEMHACAGDCLLTAKEIPQRAIFLLNGNASLHPINTVLSDLYGRRELIGFAETISRRPLCYSVIAESDCRLEYIDRRGLLVAISKDRELRNGLLVRLGTEVREIHRLFASL
ncbi:MAG TPA: cyclic nucleotide-binding domain-containing protein [Pyrinomonadaceae bacterium]|nr:cyclic nucleotide-binding domain-containing protein [Pyrinomonadaceae bacterium]HMP64645.1 cyclic nucleotide-binding domain-containing protein [Pyrinomonadaceae bacterium]